MKGGKGNGVMTPLWMFEYPTSPFEPMEPMTWHFPEPEVLVGNVDR